MKKLIFILALVLFSKHINPDVVSGYGELLFSDNFSNGHTNWTIYDDYGFSANLWSSASDKLGAKISTLYTASNGIIDYQNWTDYELKLEMHTVQGVDKNILFRLHDKTNGETGHWWYEIHVQTWPGQDNIYLSKNPDPNFSYITHYEVNNNDIYYWKIRVIGNNLKVWISEDNFITETLLFDINDASPFLHGSIGLRIGTGAVANTEVYYDNITVRSLRGLNVPHLSQRDPLWKEDIYDHNDITLQNPIGSREIEEWGCALTSAAMILNYHGFNQVPNGSPLNPSTLNQYLISNHGYTKYGGIVWSGITNAALDSKNAGFTTPDQYLLEFEYQPFDFATVESDIQNEIPDIVKIVTNDKSTPTTSDDNLHFVVATDIDTADNNKISINDPWDQNQTYATLQSNYLGKEYRQLARFTPSNTDLSYLWIYQYNPDVDILVEHEGLLTGIKGTNTFQQIPQTQYFEEGAISPPGINPQIQLFPDSITQQTFLHQKPTGGTYFIHLNPKTSDALADLEIFTFNNVASQSAHQFTQTLDSQPLILKLELFPEDGNQSVLYEDQVLVGYEYLFKLLESYFSQGELLDEDVYQSLWNQLEVSQKMLGKKELSQKLLQKPFQHSLQQFFKQGRITQSAYNGLNSQTLLLLENLQ